MKLLLVVLVLLASGCAALAGPPPTPTPEAPNELDVRFLDDRVEGNVFVVEGKVLNIGTTTFRKLRAVLALHDEQDRPQVAYVGPIDREVLLAGQESTFRLSVQNNPGLVRYQVVFVDPEDRQIPSTTTAP